MEKKKLIKLAFLVIMVLIVLIFIEVSIKGIKDFIEYKKEQDRLQEQTEIYENSEEFKEELRLTGIIGEFEALLNEKNIDKIYELIDEDYKDYKFQNNKELYNDYISSYITQNSKLSLQTYEKIDGRYICRILSYSNDEYKSFVVLIKPNQDETTYTLIFDDISMISKKENISQINNDNIEIKVIYEVSSSGVLVYSIDYTNNGKNRVNFKFDNVKLNDSYGNTFSPTLSINELILMPGEKVRQNMVFSDKNIHTYIKTSLAVSLKDETGNYSEFWVDLGEIGI